MIEVRCPTCPARGHFRTRKEARLHGWRGMGWRRPMKADAVSYWGECPACKRKAAK